MKKSFLDDENKEVKKNDNFLEENQIVDISLLI